MDRPAFSTERTRLGCRLAELARKLVNPTPQNVETVRLELDRLSRG